MILPWNRKRVLAAVNEAVAVQKQVEAGAKEPYDADQTFAATYIGAAWRLKKAGMKVPNELTGLVRAALRG